MQTSVSTTPAKIGNLLSAKPVLRTICGWIFDNPGSSRGQIQFALEGQGINLGSESSVYRSLEKIIETGLASRNGTTSGATYTLTDRMRLYLLREHLQLDESQRPEVPYHPEWLERYVPNRDHYLRASSLEQLAARCPPGSADLSRLHPRALQLFMCDLSHSSASLEGAAYKPLDTYNLIVNDIERAGGSAHDKTVILNHRDAVQLMIQLVRDGFGFATDQSNLKSLHALLTADLLADPREIGGLRKKPVMIKGTSFRPLNDAAKIKTMFDMLCDKAEAIQNPFEKAFFLSVHIPYLQPFADANKRLGRIACNGPLLASGIMPMSWLGVDTPAKHRDYNEALTLIYERNDPLLFDELFLDCYMRSTESFKEMQSKKAPDQISVNYRAEVKEAVQEKIADNTITIPANVAPEHHTAFIAYVEQEIANMEINPVLGIRYGIGQAALRAWKGRNADQAPEEQVRDDDCDVSLHRERP